jgi:hypothetical protein
LPYGFLRVVGWIPFEKFLGRDKNLGGVAPPCFSSFPKNFLRE